MAIKTHKLSGLIWFLFLSVTGCAGSTATYTGDNSMPSEWPLRVSNESSVCAPIDGTYQIIGLGTPKKGTSWTQARLDVALGYTFPSSRIPKQVSISINEGTNIINYHFGDPINQSFSEQVRCSEGWYRVSKEQNNLYLGDGGGTLDHSNREIKFGRAIDGYLIVHVNLKAQFSSWFVLKSHVAREFWSKHKKLKE